MSIKELTSDQKDLIKTVKDGLRVTKVVATRAIKTRSGGDFFVGMSAVWDSVQEDAGGAGADLIDAMGDGEALVAAQHRGMGRKQAKIAATILGMEVDIQACNHALGGGAINAAEHRAALVAIRRNYKNLLVAAVQGDNKHEGGSK